MLDSLYSPTTHRTKLIHGWEPAAPNEIVILANDLEQTLARVFKTMEGIIQHNPELQREAEVQTKTIFLANGTTVTPSVATIRAPLE